MQNRTAQLMLALTLTLCWTASFAQGSVIAKLEVRSIIFLNDYWENKHLIGPDGDKDRWEVTHQMPNDYEYSEWTAVQEYPSPGPGWYLDGPYVSDWAILWRTAEETWRAWVDPGTVPPDPPGDPWVFVSSGLPYIFSYVNEQTTLWVPEPGSLLLLAVPAAIALVRRRKVGMGR
ncbi:MAG: PEP-CTERM sorting domain-containing protein [Phycisphaerae bacterium]|nr:PEP-CTERM sorting domain-containing protein [Phycisphaerae bacterium]